MALRRVLPSRATPDKAPASAAVATSGQPEATARNLSQPDSTAEAFANAAKTFGSGPATSPENNTVAAPVPTDAFAAAATSAFSTLPTAPRVLEESFSKPAVAVDESPTAPAVAEGTIPVSAPEPAPEPAFIAPAWDVPAPSPAPVLPVSEPETAQPSTPAFSAPAWEAEAKATAAATEAAITRQAEIDATPAPEPVPVEPYVAPVWQAPASFASQDTTTAPMAMPEIITEIPAPKPLPEPVPDLAPESVAEPAPAVITHSLRAITESVPTQPEATETTSEPAGAPFEFQPSRPDNSPHKRRVREKRPRDFTAMGAPENQAPDRPKPMTSFASNVPVDTRPLDRVDEELINSGVMAPRPLDSLTGALPSTLAETVFAPLPEPASPPEPLTLPEPVVVQTPVATPALQPAAITAPSTPQKPVVPQPAPVVIADPAPIMSPVAAPIIEKSPESLPVIAPQAASAAPAFNLSNNTPAPVAAPLPPPQSDLPWTQTQSAAEWEIETPADTHWHADTGHDTSSNSPAAHMPSSTADLYKPLSSTNPAPQLPSGAHGSIPSRSATNFTPELPGQRRKPHGTPWGLIAVGVLVVAGAGAYVMRSGGTSHVQQQLASLTGGSSTPAPPAGTDANGILPPPRAENASFYSPAAAPAPVVADTSSSAVVNFADVPPEQASQPIVATGKEDIPKDMSFLGKMTAEVEKVRAAKAAGLPSDADPSATALKPGANATGAITPDKLQEELAAYRTALAQSPNPSALTPSAFKRDPDGYMDGKNQVTDGSGTPTPTSAQLASGALLPPPAGNGGVMPPPDLYTNNPKNLPVVAEPVANAPARVRTLADFPDIEPYSPEKEKVEIPKNMKPKMAATDFPALEVLSFVPGKGIVAFADGREGVLLIGESLNGWELVGVNADNAEFKAGQKSYQVTAENN